MKQHKMTIGSKLGIDATKNLPGEDFKLAWPPLIKMEEVIKQRIKEQFGRKPM
jgi:3-polyprenyl-4-hydroxybenzoate decarboxylase